jgi:hypothetical protein
MEKLSGAVARKFLSRFLKIPPLFRPAAREPLELPIVALQIENNPGLTFDRQAASCHKKLRTKQRWAGSAVRSLVG